MYNFKYKSKYLKYKSKYLQLKNQFGGVRIEVTINYKDKTFKTMAPSPYVDQINSFELFVDPVTAADGLTYERTFIEEWLSSNDTSPTTGAVLDNKNLIRNIMIKQAIDEFIQEKIEEYLSINAVPASAASAASAAIADTAVLKSVHLDQGSVAVPRSERLDQDSESIFVKSTAPRSERLDQGSAVVPRSERLDQGSAVVPRSERLDQDSASIFVKSTALRSERLDQGSAVAPRSERLVQGSASIFVKSTAPRSERLDQGSAAAPRSERSVQGRTVVSSSDDEPISAKSKQYGYSFKISDNQFKEIRLFSDYVILTNATDFVIPSNRTWARDIREINLLFILNNTDLSKIVLDPNNNLLCWINHRDFYIISYREKEILKSFNLRDITRVGEMCFDTTGNLIISNGSRIEKGGHFIMTIDYSNDRYPIIQFMADLKKKSDKDYTPKNIYYPTGIALHGDFLYVNCAIKFNSIRVFRYSTGELIAEFRCGITKGGKIFICLNKIIVIDDNKHIYVLNIEDGIVIRQKTINNIIDYAIDIDNNIILLLKDNIFIKLNINLDKLVEKSFPNDYSHPPYGSFTKILVVPEGYLVLSNLLQQSYIYLIKPIMQPV
jgi:hypothetical protein